MSWARTPGRSAPRAQSPGVRARHVPVSDEQPATSVELAGHTVRLRELRAHPQRYRAWFDAARRRPGHAICRCAPAGVRLVIREINGAHHLARWPGTLAEHRRDCWFATNDSSQHTPRFRPQPAITVTAAGTRIIVGYAFTAATSPEGPRPGDAPADPDDGPRRTRATMTGLGLLLWLLEAAGLNTWPPAASSPAPASSSAVTGGSSGGSSGGERPRRRWVEVHTALATVLATLRLGEHPAPRLAYVVAPYRPGVPDPARDARLAEFLRPLERPEQVVIRGGARRGQTRTVRHRRLLCGELKDLAASEHGHQLRLRHFPRPVFLPTELAAYLHRSYPAAFSPRHGPGARRLVLALIEGTPHGHLRLVDAAVQLTSANYIPAESSHEVAMAEALITAGRTFTKPLRHDPTAPTRPDFVLSDAPDGPDSPDGLDTVLEVWGMTGDSDYDQRKHTKITGYRAAGTHVIEWTPPEPLPDLHPDATRPAGRPCPDRGAGHAL